MRAFQVGRFVATAAVAVLLTSRTAGAQKPLRDDERAYSAKTQDRAYVAARCAALYFKMTELFFETKQPAMAERMKKEGAEFLARVPHGPENVFLEWSGEYGARLDRQEPPQTSLTGKDYVACSAMLLLIRDGDKMEKYTRAELKYLMGG